MGRAKFGFFVNGVDTAGFSGRGMAKVCCGKVFLVLVHLYGGGAVVFSTCSVQVAYTYVFCATATRSKYFCQCSWWLTPRS